jgi:hypothetical protein
MRKLYNSTFVQLGLILFRELRKKLTDYEPAGKEEEGED